MTDRKAVKPNVVRRLREAKRLTRARLAESAKLSERQLRRIEDGKASPRSVRDNTLMKLARALDVEPTVLTGESPPPDLTLRPAPVERSPLRAMVEPKARLAYTLLKRRYGVNATDLINMAPLFFTLLAEGSLAWRRERLAGAAGVLEQASAYVDGPLAFLEDAAALAHDGLSQEHDSIEGLDLLGKTAGWELGSSTDNPFAAYLRKLADELGEPDVVSIPDGGLGWFELSFDYPDYDVCGVELDEIAHHSETARRVLEAGLARIDEIPAELQGADAGEERARWLESKAPPPLADASLPDDVLAALPDADDVERMLQARKADLSDLLPPADDATGDGS